MRLFISSDIEGTCGIAHWDETEIGKPGYDRFSEQMTKEVAAVCETALQSGKTQEILIKDAHDSARNLKAEELPEEVKILRGWVGVPCNMMAGVRGCDAAVMTGYHSGAYSDGNPLSHTSNTHNMFVKINGEYASEFRINAMLAAYYGIPVLFVSGDRALCASAETIVPGIVTAPVNEGMGGAMLSVQPGRALKMIRAGMTRVMEDLPAGPAEQKAYLRSKVIPLPEKVHVEVCFKDLEAAQHGSNYPGAVRDDAKQISFDTADFYEAVRFLYFVL